MTRSDGGTSVSVDHQLRLRPGLFVSGANLRKLFFVQLNALESGVERPPGSRADQRGICVGVQTRIAGQVGGAPPSRRCSGAPAALPAISRRAISAAERARATGPWPKRCSFARTSHERSDAGGVPAAHSGAISSSIARWVTGTAVNPKASPPTFQSLAGPHLDQQRVHRGQVPRPPDGGRGYLPGLNEMRSGKVWILPMIIAGSSAARSRVTAISRRQWLSRFAGRLPGPGIPG